MTNNSLLGRGAQRNSLVAATFLIPLLLAPRADAGQQVLENPGGGSYRSGVSVISGWACNATTVTIELTGTAGSETVEANYGTPRADTAVPAHCGTGDEDNGFGVLTNLNRLGTGPATAVLKLDGVAVATNDFTITKPTDENFNRDISGSYTLPSFPSAGEALDTVFTTSIQNFGIAPAGSSPATTVASSECAGGFVTKCNLENPGVSQFVSGIVVFSGWICDVVGSVRLVLTGSAATETLIPAYGTSRGDTSSICGDSNNGFGALSNANRLGAGPATAELYIDDVLAVTNSFWVTKPSDKNFNQDLAGEYTLPGFPNSTSDTIVIWQKADQNFSIKEVVSPTGGPTPTPVPGSIPTPGITPTPSPIPTATPDGGGATPTPDGGSTPTPTPGGGGPVCGNGIVEEGENCDGADLGDNETCEEVYGGWNSNGPDDCLLGSTLTCGADCQYDGTLCSCLCLDDSDCYLPEGYLLDCTPTYCVSTSEGGACDPLDVPDCLCEIGDLGDVEGACLGSDDENDVHGFCIVNPFDPGEYDAQLDAVCNGVDGGYVDEPRCNYCDF
ncbi:MAG: hypothetical protein P8R42_00430 [Candidatus Binatia bacterium]|nr:hypothetical protein [Candidatus Binatia bacterium]